MYDSLYKTLSNDLGHLTASMVYSPLSELKIVMMDVEKQSNCSDCAVLAIDRMPDLPCAFTKHLFCEFACEQKFVHY